VLFRHLHYLIFSGVILSLLSNCNPPPLSEGELESGVVKKLIAPKKFDQMKAGGTVEITIEGQYYSGSADIQSWGDTLLKIDVYSPFGSTILHLDYNSKGASVSLPDSSFFIDKSSCMSGLPYNWAKKITIDQFNRLLQSKFDFLSELLCSEARKIEEKKYTKYIWEDSIFLAELLINKRSGKLSYLNLRPDKTGDAVIRISDFSDFFAHQFTFIDDKKNYFSIHYEKVKLY
jgi:hypothetical protein